MKTSCCAEFHMYFYTHMPWKEGFIKLTGTDHHQSPARKAALFRKVDLGGSSNYILAGDANSRHTEITVIL